MNGASAGTRASTHDRPGPARTGTGRGKLLAGYITVQAILLLGTFALPVPFNVAAAVTLSVLAWVALYAGVRRYRPEPARAWRLVLIALALAGASNFVFALVSFYPDLPAVLPVANLLRLSRFVLVAVALGMLSRVRGRRGGLADLLDACIAALGVFLVFWSSVIQPSVNVGNRQPAEVQILMPLSTFIIVALVLKVIFAGAARTRAMKLLLAGVIGTSLSPLIWLLPFYQAIGVRIAIQVVSIGGIAVWGAVGLAASLGRPASPGPAATGTLSGQRAALFAALALIGPVIWFEAEPALGRLSFADRVTPIVASALLGLLLVARLALVADTARQRADELEEQAGQLRESVRRQEALRQQLAYRALHDPLTGLPNRTVLVERVERALARQEPERRGALLLLDVDGFKDINDTYGHPAGDEALVVVARRLAGAVPRHATLARLGGDEFAVYLDDATGPEARRCAESIRREVQQVLRVGGHDVALTVSIGVFVAAGATGQLTPSSALRDADLALYAAKDAGKNRVAVYDGTLRTSRVERNRIAAGLRRPADTNDFDLHYQPVVALQGRRIVAVEALLRWTPGEGPVPPGTFIPIAEDIAAINPIGAWALRRACADAAPWYRRHGVAVSVNISGRQLDDPCLTDLVGATLAETGLPPAGLILELTETALISLGGDTAVDTLRSLHGRGVRIAVDDFGTGYSSLAYLSRLPVDIIKLDRSFAPGHGDTGAVDGHTFTHAVLRLVDHLGLVAIAEGIENEEQLEALRGMHCRYAQGYVFSEPVPAAAISAALRDTPDLAPPLVSTGTGAGGPGG